MNLPPGDDKVDILIVDDKAENLLALEAILGDMNFNIVKAHSGPEALRQVLISDFALILLDIRMPEMDGFQVASSLKKRPRARGIPIIFMTAKSADVENLFRAYSVGAVDYLNKPLEPEIVRAKVSIFAELHRKNKHIISQANQLLESERARREMEVKALEKSASKRFEELANAVPQIVWIASARGDTCTFNNRWTEYTQLSSTGSFDFDVFENVVHEADWPALRCAWYDAISSDSNRSVECRLNRASDNSFRWHLCQIVPAKDTNDKTIEWIGTLTDIHSQKISTKAKDEFLAALSHELRTPLSVILGWVNVLKSGRPSEEEFVETMDMLERNVQVLLTLVSDLLDISRILNGKLNLSMNPVSIQKTIDSALQLLEPEFAKKNIQLVTNQFPSRCLVLGDEDRIQQIIWNLISNALKFTQQNGRVEVTSTSQNGTVTITVKDNGRGIAPQFLNRVFDKFLQEEELGLKTHNGLGLGLSIVKQIVMLHGGTISVDSPGKGMGAVFKVCFKEFISSKKDVNLELISNTNFIEKEEVEFSLADLDSVNILLIDDSPDIRALLSHILKKQGAFVSCVGSVDEAISFLKTSDPDLILSDIGMPEKDGIYFIHFLRGLADEKKSKIPAIALTAYAREEDRMQAIKAGFQMHVAKPATPSVLTSAVKKVLEAQMH